MRSEIGNRLSIAGRIFAGFIIMFVAFGGVSIYGIMNVLELAEQNQRAYGVYLPLSQLFSRLENRLAMEEREINRLAETGSPRSIRALLKFHRRQAENDPLEQILEPARKLVSGYDFKKAAPKEIELISKMQKAMDASAEKWEEYREAKNALFIAFEEKAALAEALNELRKQAAKSDKPPEEGKPLDETVEEFIKSVARSDKEETEIARVEEKLKNLADHITELTSLVQKTRTIIERRLLRAQIHIKQAMSLSGDSIRKQGDKLVWGLIVLSVIALVLTAIVTIISARALAPMRTLVYGVRKLRAGEMNVRVSPLMAGAAREFAELSSEFDEMAKTLLERREALELAHERSERQGRDLKRLNADLFTVKRFNENIIQSIRHGVIAADADLSINLINPTAAKLWGTTPEEAKGKSLSAVVFGHPVFSSAPRLAKIMAAETPFNLEAIRVDSKSGAHIVDISIVPLRTAEGEADGILLIVDEVTEKLEMRRKLILHERLAVMGKLTAQIAHEIRNPLNSIVLNIEALEEIKNDAQTEQSQRQFDRMINNVKREIARLSSVTEEYLRFARLPEPDLRREDLNRIIENLLTFIEPEISKQGIKLNARFSPEELFIMGDANQLRQAFLNVVRNSLEALSEGGEITIATSRKNGGVQAEILDTGPGISAEDRERIFDPFFSTKRSGTGLGLAVTRQIIRDHGGDITLVESQDTGAGFLIYLPDPSSFEA